jgi:flavin reductase (DIM6/NTAB) family NADH-FMN oxidoreductase RutF
MLTHGVYVVCAEYDGVRGGLTVAWASQLGSRDLMICVGKQSATRDLILGSGAFGLSVLAEDQAEIARWFGRRSSKRIDKLATMSWHTLATGSPLLDDCGIALDCRVQAVYDLRSEKLILGRVVAGERPRASFDRLVYRQADFFGEGEPASD